MRVSERSRRPDASSTTAKARKATCNRHGSQRLSGAKDYAVAIDERDVDRELHEKRVDAAARRENQALSSARPERPSRPRLRVGESNAVSMGRATTAGVAGVAKDPGRARIGRGSGAGRAATTPVNDAASGLFRALRDPAALDVLERQIDRPHSRTDRAGRRGTAGSRRCTRARPGSS